MARYIDADKFKSHLEKAMEKMHIIAGVKAVDVGAVIKALDMQPTADVVPKSEVESIITLNSQLEAKVFEERKEVERLKHILDCYALQYGTVIEQQEVIDKAKAELASEIFAEIESAKVSIGDFKIKTFKIISLGEVAEQTITGDVVAFSDIAELKKKYTEGEQ